MSDLIEQPIIHCSCPKLRGNPPRLCVSEVDHLGGICEGCVFHQDPNPSLVEQHARKRRMEERSDRMYALLKELSEWSLCEHGNEMTCIHARGRALLKEIDGE